MAEEKSVNVTFRELARGVTRPVGQLHELVVRRAPVLVYNMQALDFSEQGTVLLPSAPDGVPMPAAAEDDAAAASEPAEDRREQGGQGLGLIADVLRSRASGGGKKCLVAGHASSGVSGGVAIERSRLRAQSVQLYLAGEREAWAEAAARNATPEDLQRILAFAADAFGYPSHPGEVRAQTHVRAQRALRKFRLHHDAETGSELGVQPGFVAAADYAVFFDLYDRWLAGLLGVEPAALSSMRAELEYLDPAFLGVGASFSSEPPRDATREAPLPDRVELLAFDSGDLPNLELRPVGAHIYAWREFAPLRLEVEVDGGERSLELVLHDAERQLLPNARYELSVNGRTLTGEADGEGLATLQLSASATRGYLRWTHADAPAGFFEYESDVYLKPPPADTPDGCRQWLHNLGLPSDGDATLALHYYQRMTDLDATGVLDDDTRTLLADNVVARTRDDGDAGGDEAEMRT